MNKVCCVCNELVDVRYLNLVKLEFVYTRGSQLKSMHAVWYNTPLDNNAHPLQTNVIYCWRLQTVSCKALNQHNTVYQTVEEYLSARMIRGDKEEHF